MKYAYCPACGKATTLKTIGDEGLTPHCESCVKTYFDLPRPAVFVLTLDPHGRTALLKQDYISTDYWVLVAGYCKSGETLEQTVAREVKEETGLDVVSQKFLHSFYLPSKDVLLLGFFARVEGEIQLNSQEVDDIKWVNFHELEMHLRPDGNGIMMFRTASTLFDG